MRVATVQIEIDDRESKEQRITRMERLLDQIEASDLVVLPETWPTGYFSFDRYAEEAEPIDGPFVEKFSQIAKDMKTYMFAGSFIERQGDDLYNTSVFFSPEGELIGSYRKMHLFRFGSREGEILTAGKEIVVVDTKFGKMGLSTCYDIRFPELYRKQVDLGARFLLVTAAWPHARVAHWNLFCQARALENQCYVVASNCVGTTHGTMMGGHSQIVDPWATVVATGSEFEGVVQSKIDVGHIDFIRERFPNLKHRVL